MLGDMRLGECAFRRCCEVVDGRAVRLDRLHDSRGNLVARGVGKADI